MKREVSDEVDAAVRDIIADVVARGDAALIALASTVVRRHPADRAAAVARHGGGELVDPDSRGTGA
jgi:histidinol dehydrogenase